MLNMVYWIIFKDIYPFVKVYYNLDIIYLINFIILQYYSKYSEVIYNYWLCFSWQPESKFPFAQVRLPPTDGQKPEFSENMEIEVFSRSNEHEACGWWKAIIKVNEKLFSNIYEIYYNAINIYIYI